MGIVFSIVYLCVVIGLISFTRFIRRIQINSSIRSKRSIEISEKLDKIIELLEKDKSI
jgi:hypothetical protein